MFKQVKYFVQDQICVAFIKIWPEGVVKWIKALAVLRAHLLHVLAERDHE